MPDSRFFDDFPDYLFADAALQTEALQTRRPVSRRSDRTAYRSQRSSSVHPSASGAVRAVPEPGVLTVSAAVEQLRGVVSNMLGGLWITGEVSNLSRPVSGHVYFTLKDGDAQLRCVYFAMTARRHPATFRIGERIEVSGRADIYAKGGELQLRLSDWRHAGAGELYEAYLRLKAKLSSEGLFDAGLKRRLPFFVRRVIVVTSPQAAALQDVIRTVSRRMPWVRLQISPAFVQGSEAPASLIAALKRADEAGADAVLLVRGGGSFEDLMCFNDERLVRTIRAMRTPVVAGIGHESDETLSTLAADIGASTPTAAAEQLGQDIGWWQSLLVGFGQQLDTGIERRLTDAEQAVDSAERRLAPFGAVPTALASRVAKSAGLLDRLTDAVFADAGERLRRAGRTLVSPEAALRGKAKQLTAAAAALEGSFTQKTDAEQRRVMRALTQLEAATAGKTAFCEARLLTAVRHMPSPATLLGARQKELEAATRALAALDPDRPLRQGYVRVEKDGVPVVSARDAQPGSSVKLVFADGSREVDIRR